jgi:hypothetical protein
MALVQIRMTDEEKSELNETAKRTSYPLAIWARGKLLELARAERAAFIRDRDEGLARSGKLAPKPGKPVKPPLNLNTSWSPFVLDMLRKRHTTVLPKLKDYPVTVDGELYETEEQFRSKFAPIQEPQPEGNRLSWQDLAKERNGEE